MGYMAREHEYDVMFDNSTQLSVEELGSVIDTETVNEMIRFATDIEVSPEVFRSSPTCPLRDVQRNRIGRPLPLRSEGVPLRNW